MFALSLCGIIVIPTVFAEINYSNLSIDSTSTILFEKSDSNILVVTIQLTNNSNEEFSVKFIKKPALFLIFERCELLI